MLDVGKLVVEPKPCDLDKIIRDVCSEQQDISPNHRLKVEVRGIPPAMVLDEKLIRQSLANLVSNAVKYSPRSNTVEVSAFKEGNMAVIEVRALVFRWCSTSLNCTTEQSPCAARLALVLSSQ